MMDAKELGLLIREGESLTAEFKQGFTSKIDEDLVAFSNSRGGRILLGVKDDRAICGFELTNDLRGKILSLARNCKPIIDVSICQVEKVTVISVPEGHDKPYSCSNGYYRRLDGATQNMSREELRLVFAQGETELYESKFTTGATLSSISGAKLSRFLKEAKIDAGTSGPESLLASFSMLDGENVNNAGVMFFAKDPCALISQCQSSMIAFKDTEGTIIYDRIDVKDGLQEQFSQAIFFLKKHLNLVSTIKGVKRTDEYEMPIEALREAVANAIVHRDYTVRGTDLMIRVFPDRVEIANPARLAPGLKASDLENVSIRRNEIIADMFSRLGIIERAGTGIRKMRRLMAGAGLPEPEITIGIFYRIVFARPAIKEPESAKKTRVKTREITRVKTRVKILGLLKENPGMSILELAEKTGLTAKGIEWNLAKLKQEGVIARVGPDRGGHWEVKK